MKFYNRKLSRGVAQLAAFKGGIRAAAKAIANKVPVQNAVKLAIAARRANVVDKFKSLYKKTYTKQWKAGKKAMTAWKKAFSRRKRYR